METSCKGDKQHRQLEACIVWVPPRDFTCTFVLGTVPVGPGPDFSLSGSEVFATLHSWGRVSFSRSSKAISLFFIFSSLPRLAQVFVAWRPCMAM